MTLTYNGKTRTVAQIYAGLAGGGTAQITASELAMCKARTNNGLSATQQADLEQFIRKGKIRVVEEEALADGEVIV